VPPYAQAVQLVVTVLQPAQLRALAVLVVLPVPWLVLRQLVRVFFARPVRTAHQPAPHHAQAVQLVAIVLPPVPLHAQAVLLVLPVLFSEQNLQVHASIVPQAHSARVWAGVSAFPNQPLPPHSLLERFWLQ